MAMEHMGVVMSVTCDACGLNVVRTYETWANGLTELSAEGWHDGDGPPLDKVLCPECMAKRLWG